jgi:hypothetical protein
MSAYAMMRKREGTMNDNEMYAEGLHQGRTEALAEAIDAVQDLADDSKSSVWNAALKAVESKLLELLELKPHHH